MTRRAHDLTGQAFGSLIAVERSPEAMNEAAAEACAGAVDAHAGGRSTSGPRP